MYAHIYAGRKKKLIIEKRTQNEIRAQVVDDLLHNSPIPIDIVSAQARRWHAARCGLVAAAVAAAAAAWDKLNTLHLLKTRPSKFLP